METLYYSPGSNETPYLLLCRIRCTTNHLYICLPFVPENNPRYSAEYFSSLRGSFIYRVDLILLVVSRNLCYSLEVYQTKGEKGEEGRGYECIPVYRFGISRFG